MTSNENKLISVVIPAYRAADTISRPLNSIVASSITVDDVIVVEDGVYDGLQELLSEKYDVTLITNTSNLGGCAARNAGLAIANGDYVFFLDADDYIDCKLLENLAISLDQSGADVAFGPWCFVYDNMPSSDIKTPILRSNNEFIARWLSNEAYPSCCVMWRTSALRNLGGWNESMRNKQDTELVIRALIAGFKVTVTDQGCGYYVQHESLNRVSRPATAVASESADYIFNLVAKYQEKTGSSLLLIALAEYAYEMARRAYRARDTKWGLTWRKRAKSLGLNNHIGSLAHRVSSTLLGLAAKERMASFRDSIPMLKHRFK